MENIAPAISPPGGFGKNKPANQAVLDWVQEVATLTQPQNIFWCDGSEAENDYLLGEACRQGVLIKLNQEKNPGCYLHRSNPNDVARVEQFTLICTPTKEEAGPTNNWAEPAETYRKLNGMLAGAMQGRTMFVVPYIMGPPDSPLAKVGFEITDSIYVVLSMRIMTRMGRVAVQPARREQRMRNSIAGCTRCSMSIRSAASSVIFRRTTRSSPSAPATAAMCCSARNASRSGSVPTSRAKQGWLAEHMLILGVESPDGKKHYVAAAFPAPAARRISPC